MRFCPSKRFASAGSMVTVGTPTTILFRVMTVLSVTLVRICSMGTVRVFPLSVASLLCLKRGLQVILKSALVTVAEASTV